MTTALENVDMAAIYLVDWDRKEAVLQAQRNFPQDYINRAGRIPYPKGITWKVINTGEVVNIEDIQKDPYVGPAGRALGHHGVLGIPITLEGKVRGVIWFLSYKELQFNKQEIDLLTSIGNQIAIAIARAKQTKELKEFQKNLEERNRSLSILSAISQAVHWSIDLNQVYRTTLDIVKDLKFIDLIAVYLVEGEEDKREAVLQIHQGYPEEYLKGVSRIPYPIGFTWKVITSGESVYYEDVSDPSTPVGSAGKSLGARALLSVPVESGSETTGVIHFSSFVKTSFSEQDLNFLLSLGNQIGTAIAKARMFEEMKQRAKELKALYEDLKNTQEQLELELNERKRAEEELARQAQELARSNEELQQFAYVASHDLQEPLRKIRAFGDRLKNKYAKALSYQGRDYIARMRNAAERMQTLINDLLTFSQVTTKARPFVPVNLARVVQDVLSDMEVRIEQTGGFVEVGELTTIDADPMQMRQLLQNIISNALKFHRDEEAPVVKIHSQNLDGQQQNLVRGAADNGLCQIIVEDNGVGFDEKYVDRIFCPFQRLHGQSRYEGAGIGLAICRKIVERHGGSITARSTPGQGATFIVTLPLKQPKVRSTQ